MKKFLLPEGGNFYKANLHCHSTVSDGQLSPEQLKQEYKEAGYSIIAYTDHNAMVDHSHLTDESFLALVGVELDMAENKPFEDSKCCHMCFIAPTPDANQPCYHRTKFAWGNAANYVNEGKVRFDQSKPDFEREYSIEGINRMMKDGYDNGFFVVYNHPTWSQENYEQYTNYQCMHAMEICNYGSIVEGYDEYNEREYDDMLRAGKRIYCVSTDDNHHRAHHFGGFTVIKADKIDYKTIFDALMNGHFYASQGPEIFNLYIEDEKIHINCSPAKQIVMSTARRRVEYVNGTKENPAIEGHFKFLPEDKYVRITVTDFEGKRANTNAYFIDRI